MVRRFILLTFAFVLAACASRRPVATYSEVRPGEPFPSEWLTKKTSISEVDSVVLELGDRVIDGWRGEWKEFTNRDMTDLVLWEFVDRASWDFGFSGYALLKGEKLIAAIGGIREHEPIFRSVRSIFKVYDVVAPGTAEFDSAALEFVRSLGRRDRIVEHVFEQSDMVEEQCEIHYLGSRLAFSWSGREADKPWTVTVVIVLDSKLRPISLSSSAKQLREKAAQPDATDNPDDAQRLREDH